MKSVNLHKAMCECSDGDRTAMGILRQTSLADIPDDEFAELVVAVNKAGGVAETRGLPRVLIAKAVQAYDAGVAKGDYVGHPFRGNQWSDASGASTGGAGGTPKGGKGGRNFNAGSGGAKRRAAGRYTASEQILGALNDRLRRNEQRETAEAMAQSMLDGSGENAVGELDRAVEGITNIREGAVTAGQNAEYKKERAESYDDGEGENDSLIEQATDDMKTYKRVVGYADKATAAIKEATRLVEKARKGIDIAVDIAAAQENALPRIQMARDALLKMDSELQKVGETHRQMARSGFGRAHSSAAGQVSFIRAGLRESLTALEDFRMDVEGAPEAAQEVLATMGEDGYDG